ncbi:MAG: hypothetical protein LBL46_04310 [Rickettsiales bacterium]|jgi:hypothetical protein|nr:hypothetical protein [Rickettsiales bacterium]
MLKKLLFFAALCAPLSAQAAVTPGVCDVDSNGIMTCSAGDLVNTGIKTIDGSTIGSGGSSLKSLDLSVWAGGDHPGNIINTGDLTISAPGSNPAQGGAVNIGGWIYNGTSDGTTASGVGFMSITGGDIMIQNQDLWTNRNASQTIDGCAPGATCSNANPLGVAALNLSSGVGVGNWSLHLNAANNLNINGGVWSNTIDGATQFGAGGGSIRLHAGGDLIITNGNFVSFGGEKQEISAGDELIVNGTIGFMGGATTGANVLSSAASMRIGVFGFSGDALTIANGATTTINSGSSITINGNMENSAGATTMTATGNIALNGGLNNSANLNITAAQMTATGAITNSGGLASINAGGYLNALGLNITGGGVSLRGGTGLILGTGGLSAASLQMGGAAPGAGLFITPADYSIISAGAVNLTGALDVEAGALTIAGTGGNIAVGAGLVKNLGTLKIKDNIASINITGAVDNRGTMNLATASAGITTGNITNEGTMTASAAGALQTGTIGATGAGTAAFNAGTTITTGAINNQMTSTGGMSFVAAGDISTGGAIVRNDTGGNLSFKSTGGDISVGDVDNWGAVRFETAGDLAIAALTNSKSFYADVGGAASFTSLTNAAGATEFHLKAATTNISPTQLASFLSNNIIPTMYLELTGQVLSTGGGDITNAAGVLTAKATTITAANVSNGSGTMNLATPGMLHLLGGVYNGTGTINLSGADVHITGTGPGVGDTITNHGAATIAASDDFAVGNITNAGSLSIGADTATIGALVNSGGTTTINTTSTTTIASVNATGGAVNLRGAGITGATGNIAASNGGTINVGGGVAGLAAANVNIAGAISTNGGGKLNIDSATPFAINVGAGTITAGGVSMTGTNKSLTLTAGALNLNGGAVVVNDTNTLTIDVAGAIATGGFTSNGITTMNSAATGLTASNNIVIGNGGIDTEAAAGLYIKNADLTDGFVLKTTAGNITSTGGINVGNASFGIVKMLTIESAGTLFVGGTTTNAGTLKLKSAGVMSLGALNNTAALTIEGMAVSTGAITNSAGATIGITNNSGGLVVNGALANSGAATLSNAGRAITIYGNVAAAATATTTISAARLDAFSLSNAIGGKITFDGANLNILGGPTTLTNISTGGASDGLQLSGATTNLVAQHSLTADATAVDTGKSLNIKINDTANLGVVNNSGTLTINANDFVDVASFTAAANSRTILAGEGLRSTGVFDVGNIYRNVQRPANDNTGAIEITSSDYTIKSDAAITAGKVQLSGLGNSLNLTSDSVAVGDLIAFGSLAASATKTADINITAQNISVNGKITASRGGFVNITSAAMTCPYDTTCAADSILAQTGAGYSGPGVDWADVQAGNIQPLSFVKTTGDVSGGVRFYGLGRMEIGGNYHFNDDSILALAALPAWVANDFSNAGTITETNGAMQTNWGSDAKPIVNVAGIMSLDIVGKGDPNGKQPGSGLSLHGGNIGLTIFDSVDPGKIIWLVQADQIEVAPDTYLPRNINVYFCNADGTRCFDYISALRYDETSADRTPVYIRWDRAPGVDTGDKDSLFAVFDPKYGGPIMIYNMQEKAKSLRPGANADAALGALDNLVYYGLPKAGFSWEGNNPIEAIPAAFKGTIYDGIGRAIYDRMDSFSSGSGKNEPFVDLARLVMPTEAAALGAMVSTTERMTSSGLSRRMQDEALWTRNRVKTKAWADVDAGMQTIRNPDAAGDSMEGFRLAASGGYDIQMNTDLIVGFTAGLAVVDSQDKTKVDIGLGQSEARAASAKDTDMHIGGYVLSRIADQLRVFVHAAAHSHKLSVSGNRGITGDITGDGESASIVGELGLVHSIAAQYVVGTLSARFVQNNGFDITEKIGGADYMNFSRDKTTLLTPGYTLLLQKRMYLKPTFIMRPWVSVGAEYDLMQGKDDAAIKWRFAPSDAASTMAVESDPLWLRGTAGVEFLTIGGLQFGAGAEYFYNSAIQTIGARVTASVRF